MEKLCKSEQITTVILLQLSPFGTRASDLIGYWFTEQQLTMNGDSVMARVSGRYHSVPLMHHSQGRTITLSEVLLLYLFKVYLHLFTSRRTY